MNWYLVKLIFRIICGDGAHTAQFDEQMRLIAAPDTQEAFKKASLVGKSEQETFYNVKQQPVRWTFVAVSELHSLNDLTDGAEVCSKVNEVEDAEAYTRIIHQQARLLKDQIGSSYLIQ